MAPTLVYLAAVLAAISPVWAGPDSLNTLEARHGTPNQKCSGQSCQIASLSGSSGKPYKATKAPHDMTLPGDCCLLKYNPSARKRLYAQTPGLKAYCQSHKSMFARSDEEAWTPVEDFDYDEIEKRACKPKTLIFAKGTSETGPFGNSVGPAVMGGLESAEPGQWAYHGVLWKNNEFGNTCLGHPGGDRMKAILERVAANCPNTQIVMSGYSQGAMVTRNAVAFSKISSHKHLKGIVTFGDPFKGAPVKHLKGPIIVFCHVHDRVCDGRNIVHPAHLNYVGAATDKAVQRIVKLTS